jgi:hypothetical protein
LKRGGITAAEALGVPLPAVEHPLRRCEHGTGERERGSGLNGPPGFSAGSDVSTFDLLVGASDKF